MKRVILVAGGAGYIGSHVCKSLAHNGFLPVTYDNLCSGNEEAVKWGPFEQGDIRDSGRLDEILKIYQPSAIMHFAALIQVAESVANPSEYYANNVIGTLSLLEAARRHDIQNFVFSSTAAVYGQPDAKNITEDAPLHPINPYGHTKLTAENMCRDYAGAYDMNVAILRYFNAAGADPQCETGTAYKKDTHLIPLLMRVASGDMDHIKIFGTDYNTPDGTAMRDYVHVTDIADAHIRALQSIATQKQSLTVNIGSAHAHSVAHIVDQVKSITHRDIPVQCAPRREGDPAALIADAGRARQLLGWEPQYSEIKTIIQTAWDWRQKQTSAKPGAQIVKGTSRVKAA